MLNKLARWQNIMWTEKRKTTFGYDFGSCAAYSGDGWMDGANEMTCGLDYADSLFDYKEKKII